METLLVDIREPAGALRLSNFCGSWQPDAMEPTLPDNTNALRNYVDRIWAVATATTSKSSGRLSCSFRDWTAIRGKRWSTEIAWCARLLQVGVPDDRRRFTKRTQVWIVV